MERASRLCTELHCGRKDQQMERESSQLVEVIAQRDNLTLFTDGERRYSYGLFGICHEVIRNGKPGRPSKGLPKEIRVGLKNKGSLLNRGRKRKKFEAPVGEHPQTDSLIPSAQIHANHVAMREG